MTTTKTIDEALRVCMSELSLLRPHLREPYIKSAEACIEMARDAINEHDARPDVTAALESCIEIMTRCFPKGLPITKGMACEKSDWATAVAKARAALEGRAV